ncbi:Bug family tripartite tricarboxylate transporter substrate binding protein [Rhodoplanes sp. Z2-YC6860]|uniref:Bug family tripartite tricarboxylate transporter substrate binding protein n=1 Tax=Rhodoplanes sp. Z2-YC6860 TaxID=674703 RepID=UPI00078CB292|nr:tripartite tricarboxylate transporter substrate binding protein [Rhodoplanes sp. Z2-YC6860]AMN41488.1 ABC transporter substrate-binding protein [Rhodoplanes sp. Z2-YC6860]
MAALLGCLVALNSSDAATDYPTRTVRIIIPFSAGGAPDIVMRVVAQALSEKWKQSVVIENRPGANTFTGTTAVARSEPDGYTLLFTADGTFILNPLLYASLPYTMNELAPLSLIATTPHVFAVSGKVQAQSLREFIAFAKANPGKMTFGSTGSGSIQRLAFEFFSRLSGVELVHVPYRGANETATALVAGEIDASINGAATVLPHVGQNGVRALAITTKRRSELAPDLPTMEEAGVPGFSSQGAFGLLAPAGVPQDIREKLEADLAEVLQRPEMQSVLATRYFEKASLGPVEFQKVIAEESAKWRSVIEDKKIKGD